MSKAKAVIEMLRLFSDGIQGKNELKVGLLTCNSVMIQAADLIEKQCNELKAQRRTPRANIDENKRKRYRRHSATTDASTKGDEK